ncbi:Aromatic/aminoadipate aminotransferase 1 [Elasticomyces elasticus]|nr:Aromatic/aminoadipate aminotransferase 1 [Elasticomyces elasticus]KAK3637155.1 Aromatic/aminoadipate aminotransferase 1 [Elasticomyces elasticus]KAK4914142.1 Aromatic/aminoadipate aminotransferase 1 [Elasticomyces elasticus]
MLFKLLEEHRDHYGYLDWLLHIRMEYTNRRDVILEACEQHLPKEIVTWKAPSSGMFHWLQVEWKKHPDYPCKTLEEIEDELFGSWFRPDKTVATDNMFFRATYEAAPLDQISEAVKKFGEALSEAFKLTCESNGH